MLKLTANRAYSSPSIILEVNSVYCDFTFMNSFVLEEDPGKMESFTVSLSIPVMNVHSMNFSWFFFVFSALEVSLDIKPDEKPDLIPSVGFASFSTLMASPYSSAGFTSVVSSSTSPLSSGADPSKIMTFPIQ